LIGKEDINKKPLIGKEDINKKPLIGNDKVFAEIDKVLGIEHNKQNKNYLNRDGLPVIVNTNIFPNNNNNSNSNKNSNKNEVKAVDEYLMSNYLPSSWDPRLKYHNNKINIDSNKSNNSSNSNNNNNRIIVIHAPSDQELMEEEHLKYHNYNYKNNKNAFSTVSAPPQVIDLSFPQYLNTAHSSNNNYINNNYNNQINRAVEGFSTSHIRENKLLINSDNKYILPTYYHEYNNKNRTDNYHHQDNYRHSYDEKVGSSSSNSNVKNALNMISPDIQSNIYEREKYLNKMKKLRQTMIAI